MYLCQRARDYFFSIFSFDGSKYNNVISFSLEILFRVPAHCSYTAKIDFGAQQHLSVICDWHPITLPYSSCSLALFAALPNVDALDPQPPWSASLLPRLKTSLGRLRSDLLR
ncbi:hypothetical protein N7471_005537 [Penicillium samsonianum]|uniref:uncharacterized protein n=1 Tax=Penicillium samsonianum TaxID=1882272 RepID=UPI0025492B69|nr:uncharacterized protein N7471_005537 [Penicillium samsonianum]KAJ6139051.1 hypothetical protein N7471_005537 [Penicillium samsonianum]